MEKENAQKNGERLIDLCEESDLVIGGTLFQHKTIHKLTWTSPDGRTKSQINHIIINGKWRRSLQDVRVMRSADVGIDHNLVMAKLTLKLRKAKIGDKRNQRFDIDGAEKPYNNEGVQHCPKEPLCNPPRDHRIQEEHQDRVDFQ
jgi:hypothetical protein